MSNRADAVYPLPVSSTIKLVFTTRNGIVDSSMRREISKRIPSTPLISSFVSLFYPSQKFLWIHFLCHEHSNGKRSWLLSIHKDVAAEIIIGDAMAALLQAVDKIDQVGFFAAGLFIHMDAAKPASKLLLKRVNLLVH